VEESHSISLADFLAWEQGQDAKHELIGGKIVAFSGASLDHERIVGNAYVALDSRLRPPCVVYSSGAVSETAARKKNDAYRADAVITCSTEDIGKSLSVKHPRIVIEVRSPSNVGRQWEEKLFGYRETPSIEQLIIIESESRSITSYLRDDRGYWQPGETTIGEGAVALPGVEVELTLKEIYRRTSLDA
jgi:Uma2 family endonuclease